MIASSLFLFPLLAQSAAIPGILSGTVVTPDKTPVALASVRVLETNALAQTDTMGNFRIVSLPLSKLTVTVTAKGYQSGLKSVVDLTERPETTVEFVLNRESVLEQSVVVTGSGQQELLVEAPVRTELISKTMVQQQAVRVLAEALTASVPGLRIENNCQNCGFSAIRLSGLEGPYTQVLEDGLPTVSGASMVYALDQLPTEFFESIEVVKGGASSLYGPNAVAGVINLVRREPQAKTFQVDTQAGWNRGRPEQTLGAVAQIENLFAGWSGDFYYRGFRRTHADVDRDGFSELTRRSSQAGGGTLFRRFFDGKARLTVGGSTLDEFRRGGSQLDLLPENTFVTEQLLSGRSSGFVRWNHSVNPNFYYNLSSSLSYLGRGSYYGADFDPNAYGNTRNPLSVSDASVGFQKGRHAVSTGFQYWFEHITDTYPGYGRDIRQSFKNSGVYLQDEWRINPRVVLLGGFRVDKSNLLNNAIVSPRGNLRVGLTKSLNLRLGVSTGFRAPQVFDEDLHIASVGGEVQLIRRSADLRHESSRSYTAALDYTSQVRGRPFTAGASFFWTRLNDAFQLRETDRFDGENRIFERVNGPGSRFRGIEGNLSFAPTERVNLRGGWTFQQARYDEPEPVFGSLRYFRTPNSYGFFGADLDLPGGIEFIHTFDFTGPMRVQHFAGFIDEDRVETSPWFHVWNAVVSKTMPLGSSEKAKLRVYVRANNLLDSYQSDFDQGPLRDSKYVYGPIMPRGVVTGVTLTF
ncbi:MAG: TonB-dependent receptor [Bryobacteraceae bacterium]|nr:TonB-dependent receptor [Bryobacteraceae bacterium]